MVECEAILNSHPLTVDTIRDVNSPGQLAPANILTMKPKVTLAPPGVFERPDIFSKRRWRKVQDIANKFWARSKKCSSVNSSSGKNGITSNEILKLVMWFS